MGRPEQRQRERKRAAAGSHKLDTFFVPKRKCTSDCSSDTVNEPDVSPAPEKECQEKHNQAVLPQDCSSETHSTLCTEGSGISQGEGTVATSLRVSVSLSPDIGDNFARCQSSEAFCREVQSFSSGEKYSLLKNHSKPSHQFAFPTTFTGGCNRSFRYSWLDDHPWMVYSTKVDGAFCLPCVLFSTGRINGQLVTRPFHAWQKKSEKCREHERCQYHQVALSQADQLIQSIEHPECGISALVSSKRLANIEKNRAVLKSVASAILFCGRQCIALRGDAEKLETPGNPGNFLALLKLLAHHDDTLRDHMESPAMRCVTYMSPRTQNEIIEVMGKHIILRRIVEEVKAAKLYTILADEVTSHNVEHLAFCVRFVDSHKKHPGGVSDISATGQNHR